MNIPATITAQRRKLEFDKKLKQINSDELKLKKLEQELQNLQVRIALESRPVVEEFCNLRVETLTKLKQFLSDSFFKKNEKRQIVRLMVELALGLQGVGDLRAQGFLDELITQESSQVEEEAEEIHTHHFTPTPPSEKEVVSKIEIKSLFRQLAKVFHPDKEPLEHLKDEKTDIMKKIIQAYEDQDLYGLLKIEKDHLGPREFSEDQIELYIKHINIRLKDLKAFEARLKKHGPLSAVYKFIYSRKITIQEYNISNELSKIEEEVQREKELQPILWDKGSLKSYLKS
jgi:hypothetical protein